MSFGEVGEDGTWRLRLNEFAHVLKLASRVPPGIEGALQRRLDTLPYNARQVGVRNYAVRPLGCTAYGGWACCKRDARQASILGSEDYGISAACNTSCMFDDWG